MIPGAWRGLGLSLLFALSVISTGLAAERFSVDGYLKNFTVVYFLPSYTAPADGGQPPQASLSNRLRLNLHWYPGDQVSFTAAYDLAPRLQHSELYASRQTTLPDNRGLSYRFDDLNERLHPRGGTTPKSWAVFHNLDRLFAEVRADWGDLYIGRQPIAFGSARVINPTDVIAPFDYEALDTDDRRGVDAVRARLPLGPLGEIDAGYVFGENFRFDRSAMFLRVKAYVAQTDLTVMALGFSENLLLGIDVARSIGGAGVWLEAAEVFVDRLADPRPAGSRDYFRASVGLDFSFIPNSYSFVEYHFSEAGQCSPEDYLANLGHPGFAEGAVYLLGRHYLATGATLQITPLLNSGLDLLLNVSDRSAYLVPNVEYNIAENIYLAGGAYLTVGKQPVAPVAPEAPVVLRSEFGSYPKFIFGSLRIYL